MSNSGHGSIGIYEISRFNIYSCVLMSIVIRKYQIKSRYSLTKLLIPSSLLDIINHRRSFLSPKTVCEKWRYHRSSNILYVIVKKLWYTSLRKKYEYATNSNIQQLRIDSMQKCEPVTNATNHIKCNVWYTTIYMLSIFWYHVCSADRSWVCSGNM